MKHKCARCGGSFRRTAIYSFKPSSRWYMTCGGCVAKIEASELQEEAKLQKEIRERNRKVSRAAQAAAARERTAEGKRRAVGQVVTEADAAQKAREELAVRELCRRSLLDYVLRFKSNYKAGWVHHLICRKLEQFLDDVINERSPRLMLFMPPRHGKSELISDKFPSWAMGKYPQLEIILSSYAATLAVGFSQFNRDRLKDPVFQQIFPNCKLDADKQGSELWRTTQSGGFLAAGVGGPVTGRGANIFIVDDPVKNYEEAESETTREAIKNWWRSTARTRLSPGGGVLIIQCMTGDTPVLMASGAEKALADVRPGDCVASYDNGRLVSARVLNWASQGRDSVFRITTSSGKMVRANGRHPFLVEDRGELKWVRVRDLMLHQRVVTRKASGASGEGKLAVSRDVTSLRNAEGSARLITTSGGGPLGSVHRVAEKIRRLASVPSLSTATALRLMSISGSWLSKAVSALFAELAPNSLATPSTGMASCASITATTPIEFAGCSVTSATSWLVKTAHQRSLKPPQSTFATEEIVAIEPAGMAEVFDIQVEGTENFIANGLVSHNTRWHDDDLSGWLIREFQEAQRAGIPGEELEEYEVVSLPAIAEENEYIDAGWNLYYDENKPKDCIHVRRPGDALHPARYGAKYLNMTRRSMGERMFGALYQQNPVPDSGDFFRAEDFRTYGLEPPHMGPRPVYFAWDLAISQRQSGDFTVGVAAMYDEHGNLFILDIIRGRWRTSEITDRMVDLIARYPHNRAKLGVEQGQIWNAIQDDFWRKLHLRGLSISRDETLRPMMDKRLRARPLQAWMQAGRVKFPSQQPWVEQAKGELLRFDAGVNDDVVDALAWLVRMLENEPVPDVERMRRLRDRYYINKDKLVKGYMQNQLNGQPAKRYMAS